MLKSDICNNNERKFSIKGVIKKSLVSHNLDLSRTFPHEPRWLQL